MTNPILRWLILIALVLFVIAFVIFWFGGPSFSENQVVLKIDGPNQAAVGDEVVYKVSYQNGTKTPLEGLSFKFTYPDGSVVLKNGQATQGSTEQFAVDTLGSGASGEKEFRAFLVGDRGDIKTAKVELLFKAGTLQSTFDRSSTVSTTVVNVPVALTLVAPPNAVAGQLVSYILDYRNESSDDISDLKFEFAYPDGFNLKSATPQPTGSATWAVNTLKHGSGGRITIQGTLTGREGDSKSIRVVLKRKVGSQYIDYEHSSISTVISNPLLSASILVNNSSNYSANLGDVLEYAIHYKNSSSSNLIGVNLVVKLEGDMYDFSSLDTKGGFYDSSTQTILWNASTVSNFSALQPGMSGDISFKIKLRSSFPSGISGTKGSLVKASATLSTPNVPANIDASEISATDSIVTGISTQPKFKQLVYYNDPAFGLSGPLPPEVGKETVFTIHWQLINPGSDMNQAKISGILPAGVVWKNIVSVGSGQAEPVFNSNASQVVWDIGVVPQGTGVATPKYEASFQVSVRPSQAGSAITLIKNSQFSGIDSFTKQSIIVNSDNITTDDPVDRPNQGAVTQPQSNGGY